MFRELIHIDIGNNVVLNTNYFTAPLGVVIYLLLSYLHLKRRGYEPDLIIKFHIVSLIGAALTSPLYLLLVWASSFFTDLSKVAKTILFGSGGIQRAWIGGGLLSFIYLWKVKKIERIWHFYDNLIPYLAFLFGCFKLLHCFVYGCCFGRPTHLPWGVVFPKYTDAYKLYGDTPIHPVQIYNAIGAFIIMGIGLWLLKRKDFDGEVVLWLLFMGGTSKIFEVLFYRGDMKQSYDVLYISIPTVAVVAITMMIIYTFVRRDTHTEEKW